MRCFVLLECVQLHLHHQGSVGGKFGGAQPWHKCAGAAGHGSNFRVVSGNQNVAYFGNAFYRINWPCNQWFAA